MPPAVPSSGGAGGLPGGVQERRAGGVVALVKTVIGRLQEIVEREWPRLRRAGTCGREFMELLDRLEEEADREATYRGLQKIPEESVRRPEEYRSDIVIGYYLAGNVVVEIGLRGLNRCGVLEELTGGEPPRVYARLYMPGGASIVIEAGEERRRTELSYYI